MSRKGKKSAGFLTVGALLVALFNCTPVYFQPRHSGEDYRWAVERWQQRSKAQAWTEAFVDEVVAECLRCARFEPEDGDDYWKTYREFLRDFTGDCEDIAVFMFGTLKRLGCPYEIRLRIVREPLGDHAVLAVRLSDGRWKVYNTVRAFGAALDVWLSRIVVEWDLENIYYP